MNHESFSGTLVLVWLERIELKCKQFLYQKTGVYTRHRENFWVFSGPRRDFGLILLILNMIIHRSFTGPTHLLSANVRGPVSFAVSATLSFLAGCPKSHFLGWYRNFLVYWYLKLDNQAINSTCPKDKIGWIWQADDPKCRTLENHLNCHSLSLEISSRAQWVGVWI